MVQSGLDDVWRQHSDLGPELKREIDRAIDAEIAARLKASIKLARRLLEMKPSKFSDRFGL